MQRAARAQRHEDQFALGGFGRLADRFRHFARLAVAEADAALLVADDDECCKAEATAALDDLGDAVDVDELVDEFAVALFAVRRPRPPSLRSCAISCSLFFSGSTVDDKIRRCLGRVAGAGGEISEAQAAFAGGFGQRLDAAVIDVGAAVEDDFLDAGLGGALGDQLADGSSGGGVGAGLQRTLQILLEASRRRRRCGPSTSSMIWA